MASTESVVPVPVVAHLVAEAKMVCSDPTKTINLARVVPRAVLEESRVLEKAAAKRITETTMTIVAAGRARESAVAADPDKTIINQFERSETPTRLLLSSLLGLRVVFSPLFLFSLGK